jgi:hypothetical protein
MTNAAVEERAAPITQETEAPDAVETEALRGTDDADSGVQTGDEARSTTEAAAPPDGRASRLSALSQAEIEEAEQRGEENALKKLQQGTTKQQQEQNRKRLKDNYPVAQAAFDRIFAGAKDEWGNPRPLTEAEQTQAKNVFSGHNLLAWDSAEAQISDIVRDAVYAKLDKDGQETLHKLADGDEKMPLPQYLDHYAELAALHTKAVKSLDLESALKVSTKLKKDIAARDVLQYDEGFNAGLNAPTGTSPRDGGATTSRSAPGLKTFEQLQASYGDPQKFGKLTPAEEKRYLQLDAEKKRR